MKKADVVDDLDALASIRRGLAQAKEGLGCPVDEVFDDLEREVAEARPAGSGTDLRDAPEKLGRQSPLSTRRGT